MSELIKSMDSVFNNCAEDDLEFDTLFDQEDSLIDTVNGVNEAGEPLTGSDFGTLHQEENDSCCPVKQMKDELGPGHDTKYGSPNPEGADDDFELLDNSLGQNLNKESDADKFHGNSEEDYQSLDKYKDPDENDLSGTINSSIKEGEDIDSQLDDGEPSGGDGDIDSELDGESISESKKVKDIDSELDRKNVDDQDIDSVLDDSSSGSTPDLKYNISDEELIDMAMNS